MVVEERCKRRKKKQEKENRQKQRLSPKDARASLAFALAVCQGRKSEGNGEMGGSRRKKGQTMAKMGEDGD